MRARRAQFTDVAELLKFLISPANLINSASTSLKAMLACALVVDMSVLIVSVVLAAAEGPPDASGTSIVSGTSVVSGTFVASGSFLAGPR